MAGITNNQRKWHLINMDGKIYGRELSRVANLLCGKHKVGYLPNLDFGDYIVMINVEKARFSGNKTNSKMYYKHTSFIGNLKSSNLQEMLEKDAVALTRKSVSGMLPKNKLRDERLLRLKIYLGNTHPHQNIKFEE